MAVKRCSVRINNIQRELKEHGTAQFPIGCYNDYLPTDEVPWHWHEHLELGYVKKGQLWLGVNTDQIEVHEGEAFFVNKEILHSCWCDEGRSCLLNSVVFKAELLGAQDSIFYQSYTRRLIENADFSYGIFAGKEDWQRKILELDRHMWEYAETEGFGYEFQVREDLSKMVLLMLKNMSKQPKELTEKALRTERRMKLMLRFIDENYSRELTIQDIAASAAVSESECMRCFHDGVGISPIKYTRQVRLQNASELLLGTDKPISEIADSCGFQDMSCFTKTFREMKGMTPSEFRKLEPK